MPGAIAPIKRELSVLLVVSVGLVWVWRSYDRTISQYNGPVKIIKGGCQVAEPLAGVQSGDLHLSGTVPDEAAASRARSEAQNVWWVSRVIDDLQVESCLPCPEKAVVHFETDVPRARTPMVISSSTVSEIEEAATRFVSCGLTSAHVAGWADERWPSLGKPYNQDLSERRAKVVAQHLNARLPNLEPAILWHGSETKFGSRSENRRVEIKGSAQVKEPKVQNLLPPGWMFRMMWSWWGLFGVAGLILGFFCAILAIKLQGLMRSEREWRLSVEPSPLRGENRLEIIEGIGPYYAKRIDHECGIRTISELANLTDAEKRAHIAAMHPPAPPTGHPLPAVSPQTVNRWIAMAQLLQLPTVTKDWAELLVYSGIVSIENLARQNKKELVQTLKDTNDAATVSSGRRIATLEPTELEVGYFINLARDLEEAQAREARLAIRERALPLLARLLGIARQNE